MPIQLRSDEGVMRCPKCHTECHRDSVDIGVGIQHGPWGCPGCAWSEDSEYDLSDGRTPLRSDGSAIDQYGGLHPAGSSTAAAIRLACDADQDWLNGRKD